MHFSPEPMIDTTIPPTVWKFPTEEGQRSARNAELSARLKADSAISFAPPPVVSSVDQDKQKYYLTLVQAGVDPSMAQKVAGFAAPVKGYMDMAQGKKPFAQGDSWNISGTPFGPNPHATGIWNF